MRPRPLRSLAIVGLSCFSFCVVGLILARSQEPTATKSEPPKTDAAEGKKAAPFPDRTVDPKSKKREIEAALDRMFEDYDLKPHPPGPIPDDPPPHEGAMIALPPYIIEPPDLLLVEVLEALPGRPISGERLVRPDGKINLGFYGEVQVAGLTVQQAKVKIIKHLRTFLIDDVLGLILRDFGQEGEAEEPFPPARKPQEGGQARPEGERKPKPTNHARPAATTRRVVPVQARARTGSAIRVIARTQEQEQQEKKSEAAKEPIKTPLEAGGKVTITIEVQPENKPQDSFAGPAEEEGSDWKGVISPESSNRVFVDVTAYNSKNYYVLGDVAVPGRLPITGKDTVLDALQFAGGLLAISEPRDIRLVRPARGGKPEKVYKVDLEAIQQRGDARTNYQIFPDDRLLIGRNEVVKKTIELDREAVPLQTIMSMIQREASVLQSVRNVGPSNTAAIYNDLVEFWVRELKRTEGAKLDEQTLRDALLRRLQGKPEEPAPK